MATHSSILAWRIQRTEKPHVLWSIASQRVRHDWSDLACTEWIIKWIMKQLDLQEFFSSAHTFGIPTLCHPVDTPTMFWDSRRSSGKEIMVPDSRCNSALFRSCRYLVSSTFYGTIMMWFLQMAWSSTTIFQAPKSTAFHLFHFKALLAHVFHGATWGVHIHHCCHIGTMPSVVLTAFFVQTWRKLKKKKKSFIDYTKAFDSVDHKKTVENS